MVAKRGRFCYYGKAVFTDRKILAPQGAEYDHKEVKMNNYELLYIIDNAAADDKKEALIEKFSQLITDNGGVVEKVDKWGSKKLAYPIDFKNDGYYVLMNFSSKPEFPTELERQFRINDAVIRFMIVKK